MDSSSLFRCSCTSALTAQRGVPCHALSSPCLHAAAASVPCAAGDEAEICFAVQRTVDLVAWTPVHLVLPASALLLPPQQISEQLHLPPLISGRMPGDAWTVLQISPSHHPGTQRRTWYYPAMGQASMIANSTGEGLAGNTRVQLATRSTKYLKTDITVSHGHPYQHICEFVLICQMMSASWRNKA